MVWVTFKSKSLLMDCKEYSECVMCSVISCGKQTGFKQQQQLGMMQDGFKITHCAFSNVVYSTEHFDA
jgi:hypothetical protein